LTIRLSILTGQPWASHWTTNILRSFIGTRVHTKPFHVQITLVSYKCNRQNCRPIPEIFCTVVTKERKAWLTRKNSTLGEDKKVCLRWLEQFGFVCVYFVLFCSILFLR
jgi:hypothetical protein